MAFLSFSLFPFPFPLSFFVDLASSRVCTTSANLSKAAWGSLNKQQDLLTVRHFEIGVLCIPQQCNAVVLKSLNSRSSHLLLPLLLLHSSYRLGKSLQ